MAAVGISTITVTSMASKIAKASKTLSGRLFSLVSINNLQEAVKCHVLWIVFHAVNIELHFATAIVSFIHPPG
jgi:hypothetical protein